VEEVTLGTCTCNAGHLSVTSDPWTDPTGCWTDMIINNNGPPQNVGPCSDTTYQIAYCGPTREKVKQCSYNHAQIITVTSAFSPGFVITSSAGASVICEY
jgi:hypothetical protein